MHIAPRVLAADSFEASQFPSIHFAPEGVTKRAFLQGTAAHESSTTGYRRLRGELAAGGRLVVESRVCRVFDLGAHARLGAATDGPSPFSGEQWLSGCFAMEKSIVPVVLARHHLEWMVRPAFSASPLYWRAPYTRENIGVDLSLIDADVSLFAPESTARFRFGHVGTNFAFLVQGDSGAKRSRTTADVDVSMVQWFQPRVGAFGRNDYFLDVLRISIHSVGEAAPSTTVGYNANVYEIAPVSFTALRLGGGLFLDARLAYAQGSIHAVDRRTVDSDPNTPRPPPLLSVSTAGADVGVYWMTDSHTLGVRYSRAVIPTLDLTLGLQDRAIAWFSHRVGRLEVSASTFAATTTVWDRTARTTTFRTGGAEAYAIWSLDPTLRLRISSEAARTFYARLDANHLAPRPEWAFRSMAMLTWSPWGA